MALSSLSRWIVDPKKNPLAAIHMKTLDQRLRRYGLRLDDLYDPKEDLDIKEALNRLPREIVDARNQRLKRAMDLSMKHEYLHEDLQSSCRALLSAQSLRSGTRGFSSSPSSNTDKLAASVLFERLPLVIPKIDPSIYAFQEFSFRWKQQFRREYPENFLKKSEARGQGDYHIDYKPAPRITDADKTNDRRSLQRALDRRLFLLIYGPTFDSPDGKPVWHFPEKVYESEETMRKCAESALQSVIGDLSHTYFVGNAPMGHMDIQPTNDEGVPSFKRFFYKSQVIAANKFNVRKCDDFVWVTKAELLEYFPDQADFLNKLIFEIR